MDTTAENKLPEQEVEETVNRPVKTGWFYIFPVIVTLFFVFSFMQIGSAKEKNRYINNSKENQPPEQGRNKHDINFAALLANDQFSKNLRDTIYTDLDVWLELRIDQQTLYVHHRDGRITRYPVSTGIPGASKSVESRPGLFAVFLKEEVHLSSQFNNARMNYYMPYNMGIGFHGLPGTGYYGNLGVRPSSHGCIRMRNEDVRALFGICKIGTLVLSHKGYSARTIAFAPEGFENETEYTKDDYMKLMAHNLGSILEGQYFIHPPKRFIIDGTIIPKSGVTVASTNIIPERQYLPSAVAEMKVITDRFNIDTPDKNIVEKETGSLLTAGMNISSDEETENPFLSSIEVDPEKMKKYSYNPLGILPYFGPKK